jgi:c(7)-type cytochrome triheme protein
MRVSTFLADSLRRILTMTRGRSGLRVVFACALALLACGAGAGEWVPLKQDGIHDPKSRAIKILQPPQEALSKLTPDGPGNQVRWVQALDKGEIRPREKLFPQTVVRKLDQDIILDIKGAMPAVRFPHRQHTEWLDCVNCHDGIFKMQTGATKITMFNILQGEQCGICHGAVAFPLTECMRCHSISKSGDKKPELPPGADMMMHRAKERSQ